MLKLRIYVFLLHVPPNAPFPHCSTSGVWRWPGRVRMQRWWGAAMVQFYLTTHTTLWWRETDPCEAGVFWIVFWQIREEKWIMEWQTLSLFFFPFPSPCLTSIAPPQRSTWRDMLRVMLVGDGPAGLSSAFCLPHAGGHGCQVSYQIMGGWENGWCLWV